MWRKLDLCTGLYLVCVKVLLKETFDQVCFQPGSVAKVRREAVRNRQEAGMGSRFY